MADYYFCTRRLDVGYDGQPLISDIKIDVARGEIVTLIGPNGSGKSTILKSVTRQLRLLGGEVYVGGEELRRHTARSLARKMAVVLTDRVRPELMTCRDVVSAGRYPYTGRLGILSPEDERQVDNALSAVQAADIAGRDFNAVSDGQRQRVLLARAICQQPEIIVLDEPTSFLDVRHKLQLLGILHDMARRRGIAVVMALHEIDLAQKISDKIVCVKDGRVAGCGPPEEVFDGGFIRELYGIERGGYDPLFGSVELPPPEGTPEAFVICGAGTGIPVFRRLQKEGVPFVAGILHENDVDCALARQLAAEVVTEAPFRPIGEPALQRALALMDACRTVIDAAPPVGPMNAAIEALAAKARGEGKIRG